MTSPAVVHAAAQQPRVLVDFFLPRTVVGNIAAVTGVLAIVALSAQVAIPLPFTPVPLTLQTFAVLVGAAAVGPLRGAAAMLLYFCLGAVGLPIFAGGAQGVQAAFGVTFGYLVGFVFASLVVGRLADKQADRRMLPALGSYCLGSLVIYICGAGWLAVSLQISPGEAIAIGVLPFLLGDAVKALAAAGLLPATWRLGQRLTRD